jgi:hypothetical protein
MDATKHQLMQLMRSLKSSRSKWWLDKTMNDIRSMGDSYVTEEVKQVYQTVLEALEQNE